MAKPVGSMGSDQIGQIDTQASGREDLIDRLRGFGFYSPDLPPHPRPRPYLHSTRPVSRCFVALWRQQVAAMNNGQPKPFQRPLLTNHRRLARRRRRHDFAPSGWLPLIGQALRRVREGARWSSTVCQSVSQSFSERASERASQPLSQFSHPRRQP